MVMHMVYSWYSSHFPSGLFLHERWPQLDWRHRKRFLVSPMTVPMTVFVDPKGMDLWIWQSLALLDLSAMVLNKTSALETITTWDTPGATIASWASSVAKHWRWSCRVLPLDSQHWPVFNHRSESDRFWKHLETTKVLMCFQISWHFTYKMSILWVEVQCPTTKNGLQIQQNPHCIQAGLLQCWAQGPKWEIQAEFYRIVDVCFVFYVENFVGKKIVTIRICAAQKSYSCYQKGRAKMIVVLYSEQVPEKNQPVELKTFL